jgi:hypothetical protein
MKAVRCVAGDGDIVLERRHKSDGGGTVSLAVSDADGQWQNAEVTGSCTLGTFLLQVGLAWSRSRDDCTSGRIICETFLELLTPIVDQPSELMVLSEISTMLT